MAAMPANISQNVAGLQRTLQPTPEGAKSPPTEVALKPGALLAEYVS